MQTVAEYLSYWGFNAPPFSLAPQASMFYVGGQYYECLEKLKYAIRTKRGGGILVSDEAGLGKTSLVLKLIEEARDLYGKAFRYVFIEHPSFDAESIIASVTMEITSSPPKKEKHLNLKSLRDSLIDVRSSGGHCLIVIDEAHLFKNFPMVLQELRMLMNMTYEGEYLHTLILSGLKELWEFLSSVSEFWQRLTIRCYLFPLSLKETRDLVEFRIKKAGSEIERIFNESALSLIHRLANGCPRTVLALCDFSLIVGFNDRITRIGEKEVLKAYETLCGKTELGVQHRMRNSQMKPLLQKQNAKRDEQKKRYSKNFRLSALLAILFLLIGVKFYLSFFGQKPHFPPPKATKQEEIEISKKLFVEVNVPLANVREAPGKSSRRIAILAHGERLKVEREVTDSEGQRWFGVTLYGQKTGWISERVVRMVLKDADS